MKEQDRKEIVALFEYELNNVRSTFNAIPTEKRKKVIAKVRNIMKTALNRHKPTNN